MRSIPIRSDGTPIIGRGIKGAGSGFLEISYFCMESWPVKPISHFGNAVFFPKSSSVSWLPAQSPLEDATELVLVK